MAGTRDRRQLEQLNSEVRRLRSEASELRARNARLRRAGLDVRRVAVPPSPSGDEASLRRSEARYRSLIQASASLVWIRDSVGRFVDPQPGWQTFTGQPWSAHRGRGWMEAYHPDDRAKMETIWRNAIESPDAIVVQARVWHAPTGAYRHVMTRAVPIRDELGTVIEWVGTLTDVEEQHRMEEALRAAIRSRDEFLSIAAHELKTPITSLRGFAQLELRRLQAEQGQLIDRLRETLGIVIKQSDRLSRLVSELLDVARLEMGRLTLQKEPLDLVPVVRELVSTAQATTTGHTFVLRLPRHAAVTGDSLRLGQVVINLISNAVKYSPDGGEIEVVLETTHAGPRGSTDAGDTSPSGETGGGWVRLAVRDHGIGVPPEHRQRIFDRFYQAHTGTPGQAGLFAPGMGLGLYISRQLVELHGGEIRAEFPDDGGTRFVVMLPR